MLSETHLKVKAFVNKISSLSRFHVISGFGKPSALHNKVASWPTATFTFDSIPLMMSGARVTCKSTSRAIVF